MNKQNYKEVSTIGRWGRMHGRYLKDNHPVRYTVLLLSGKLNGYLVEFDQQAKKQLELIVQQMAEREDVTEELKASDQMEWVRRMNSNVPSKHAYLCNRVPQDGWKNNGSL